jgi:hypothetical protein
MSRLLAVILSALVLQVGGVPSSLGKHHRAARKTSTLAPKEAARSRSRLVVSPKRGTQRSLKSQRSLDGEPADLRLQRYLQTYADYQRRYNGERPVSTVVATKERGEIARDKGKVPYWDIDIKEGSLLGKRAGSPFSPRKGKLRIPVHFSNEADIQRMIAKYGPPTGFLTGASSMKQAPMLDSWRVLLVNDQYEMKFTIRGIMDRSELSQAIFKQLAPYEVKAAIANSRKLERDPLYYRESWGVVLDLKDGGPPLTALARQIPLPRRGLQEGDVLLPAHVLSDPRFARTALGQQIFGLHGSQTRWYRKELAPAMAKLLWHCLTRSGFHSELHAQNVVAILDKQGHIVELKLKDLQDVKSDRPLRRALGLPKIAASLFDIPERFSTQDIADYYATYFGQMAKFDKDRREFSNDYTPFAMFTVRELLKIAAAHLDLEAISDLREYKDLFQKVSTQHLNHDPFKHTPWIRPGRRWQQPWRDPMWTIARLRELLIRVGNEWPAAYRP